MSVSSQHYSPPASLTSSSSSFVVSTRTAQTANTQIHVYIYIFCSSLLPGICSPNIRRVVVQVGKKEETGEIRAARRGVEPPSDFVLMMEPGVDECIRKEKWRERKKGGFKTVKKAPGWQTSRRGDVWLSSPGGHTQVKISDGETWVTTYTRLLRDIGFSFRLLLWDTEWVTNIDTILCHSTDSLSLYGSLSRRWRLSIYLKSPLSSVSRVSVRPPRFI